MDLDDLDELAAAYADAWTAATAARRGRLRNDLVCRCLPFAGRMARRYAGRGEPLEDLQQVARIGLINAVDRYDPGRGSFTAFAVVTVCGELKRHFRDKTWGLHVSRRLQGLCVDLRHATVTLTNALQREPTIEELAHHLDVSAEQIRQARLCGAAYTPVPLSSSTGHDGSLELDDALGDPDPDLEILTDKLAVTELVHQLPQRIRRMLALRFCGNLTQAQIAAEFNISQMQVSRLLARGLIWLRAAMLSDVPPPWTAGENPRCPDGIRIRIGRSKGAVTVRVTGEVDRATADQLRFGLHSAVVAAAHGRLVIDVSGMPLADGAAVAVLREAYRTAALAHVEVTLIAVPPHVAPVIATFGLA
ncbi:sigma-70 family RNA polymerase sigma factor [Paractinoplanes globisporus]|uniref:sigma-70 family RNA polymerase sigma factor n=1 Tax=Paractinoplanes globisporus TaxID=113565 RepID=UPI000364D095|nr:sigma-70 family RNA polymerase sigma factor [Actinoplanes globisporus]